MNVIIVFTCLALLSMFLVCGCFGAFCDTQIVAGCWLLVIGTLPILGCVLIANINFDYESEEFVYKIKYEGDIPYVIKDGKIVELKNLNPPIVKLNDDSELVITKYKPNYKYWLYCPKIDEVKIRNK